MRPTDHAIHRSDPEIFTAVRHALDVNPAVPAAVHAHVTDGTVTLTGSVRTSADRMAAEETVRRMEGVRRVINDIFVGNRPIDAFEPPDEAR